jgi:quinoprotein glucose dehydrogenase
VPAKGEFGYQTWMNGSADSPRGVSAWPPLSADEDLGLIYVPFSSPSNDYYGGNRPGQNLFGSSIVCLKAKTGKRVWHFQLAHHDLWDYDPPAAPILADLNAGGKKRKVVVQLTKQGFCFVLDRATGEPIWPIREVPVPQSDAPHERTSATQPIPSKPAPFDRQGTSSDADLIDFTPELRKEAQSILAKHKRGPLYSPPSFLGTLAVPGAQGGASWAGGALDPESGMLYVPSATRPYVMKLSEISGEPNNDRHPTSDRLRGSRTLLMGPDNLPLFKPPFGRITAIDLNAGEHRWMIPSGDGPRSHPRLRSLQLPPLGWPLRTFVLLTKTLLFAAQEGPVEQERMIDGHLVAEHSSREAKLRAYDKKTGKLLAEIEMPLNASGSPMTYLAGGLQHIVVAVGGSNLPAELIAYRTE